MNRIRSPRGLEELKHQQAWADNIPGRFGVRRGSLLRFRFFEAEQVNVANGVAGDLFDDRRRIG